MKKFKLILICTIVTIFLQQLAFLYVENIYISRDDNIEAVEVEENDEEENETITLKDNAENINVSTDGLYVAYNKGNNLLVYNSEDDSVNDLSSKLEGQVVSYKWTDGSKMYIIKRVSEGDGNYFKATLYDAKEKEFKDLIDYDKNDVKIAIENKNDVIGDFTFSTASAVMYIKVNKSNGNSDLYMCDTMNKLKKVRKNKEIGDIELPTNLGKCIMTLSGVITILDGNDIPIPEGINPRILGSSLKDKTNYIYIGNEENGKITKILYKQLDSTGEWNTISLKEPVLKSDIKVTKRGNVYVNYSNEKLVLNVDTEKEFKYKGEFVQYYADGFISKQDNDLIKTPIS